MNKNLLSVLSVVGALAVDNEVFAARRDAPRGIWRDPPKLPKTFKAPPLLCPACDGDGFRRDRPDNPFAACPWCKGVGTMTARQRKIFARREEQS